MNVSPWIGRALLASLCAGVLGACDSGNFAEAEGRRLSTDQAAALLAQNLQIPVDTQSVRVLGELWVDYSLLSGLVARDPDLATLDVSLMTRTPIEQMMLSGLQESVLQPDTAVTREELAARFAADMPGAQIEASHIMLIVPPNATPAGRDSVVALAAEIVRQLRAGEDFGRMARIHSDDSGSAARGGRLGSFAKGEMLPELEAAVLGLGPGEISDPVSTAIGVHVARLDRLTVPELDQIGDQFRVQLQRERLAEAEAAYIQELEEASNMSLEEGALDAARSLAQSLGSRLTEGAADRPLVRYDGGAFTVREYQDLLGMSPLGFVDEVAQIDDEQLEIMVLRLGRQELLLREAEARGLAPDQATVDSLEVAARRAVKERATEVGLADTGVDGEIAVDSLLAQILSGRTQIQPLGGITFLLRDQLSWSLDTDVLGDVVEMAEAFQPAEPSS